MDKMTEFDWTSYLGSHNVVLPTAITLFIILASIYIYRLLAKKMRRIIWNAVGVDVILVHCPTPGFFTPNVSPFVMKLLTYLRLAQIPYKLDHSEPCGDEGKTPWITLNGEHLFDSQLIIDTLSVKFEKDFSSLLSEEERAVSRAFAIMTDEHLSWGLRVWRFNVDNGRNLLEGMKHPFFVALVKPFFLRNQRNSLWHQGLGRHTPQYVQDVVMKDLKAISQYLGEKLYFMGDNLSEVDCSIFSFLANIEHNYSRSPYYKAIKEDYSNLHNYVARVKEKLWPDWDECLEQSEQSLRS